MNMDYVILRVDIELETSVEDGVLVGGVGGATYFGKGTLTLVKDFDVGSPHSIGKVLASDDVQETLLLEIVGAVVKFNVGLHRFNL